MLRFLDGFQSTNTTSCVSARLTERRVVSEGVRELEKNSKSFGHFYRVGQDGPSPGERASLNTAALEIFK